MKTSIKIMSIFGKLLFEYECEENSIKKTVEQAVKEKINLSNSDLSNSNLRNSNLRNSDLRNSNLTNSDLSNSNLSYSDLSNSNLSNSNLSNSNLRNSDLRNSKNKETASLPMFCKWSVCVIGDKIKIGCKENTIEDWDLFFESSEEFDTKRNTEDFKQIQAMYLAYKAYLTHLK